MEKFIRTKDGIYDTNKLNLNKIIGNIKYEIIDNILFKTMYGYEAHLYEYEIISKSDNLAELCDCLMIVDEDGDFFITQVYKINIPYYIKDKKCFGCIKIELPNGAIRIESVAKMNDDGKLVLI